MFLSFWAARTPLLPVFVRIRIPDPSISKQKKIKPCFPQFSDLLSFEEWFKCTHIFVMSMNLFFVGILKATEEKSRIQNRIWSRIRIRNPGTDPQVRTRIWTLRIRITGPVSMDPSLNISPDWAYKLDPDQNLYWKAVDSKRLLLVLC